MVNIFKNKVYVIVSKWGYPFGGGESFLYTTIEWATKLGMHSYWLCFTDAKNKNFEELTIEKLAGGYMIKIPGGYNDNVLYNWLRLLNPHFVHHQGHMRRNFYNVCEKLRIEFISGFHFWFGAIILDSAKLNANILENYACHKTDPELEYMLKQKYATLYTVTPFVSECIEKVTGYKITDHIYSSSSIDSIKIPNMNIKLNKFVTMVNIHYLKGGELFLYLIEKCTNISFLGIKTEYFSDELDEKIRLAMDKRNNSGNGTQCILLDRIDNPKIIYQQTQILLAPAIVDETFCRVVNEAMMNGIPVVSTGQGNIKNLMGNSGYILPYDNKDLWVNTLNYLYNNDDLLTKQSEKTLQEYENYSETKAFELFKDITKKVMLKSKDMNVMIFTPWCDQGLGIQSRNYAHILNETNYNVFIFALKPYNANTCLELQKDPNEWILPNKNNNYNNDKYDNDTYDTHSSIYYSSNDREHVTDAEIINFVKKYNIGKCLLPETCWFRVFEIAKLLNRLNVKCYAIPNIEIVRKDELYKHRYFYKILCNNKLCLNIFNKYGVNNTNYIGYGINDHGQFKTKIKSDKVKFLFIGGMNAFSRKHILDICEGFSEAYKNNPNIHLTCTIQKTNLLEIDDKEKLDKYMDHPGIIFIQSHLSYTEIMNLYYSHHVSIQVSKHEGLGIGFYESLSTGTPIITLDTAPHNEIVIDNVNGWIIPCYYKTMTDNKDPIFESAYFDPKHLAKKIYDISINFNTYDELIKKLMIDYIDRLHIIHFKNRFLESLN